MAVGLQGISTDCTDIICDFLSANEVCALRGISLRCQHIAASASSRPRSLVYREDVDADPLTWLAGVGTCFTNIASVEVVRFRDGRICISVRFGA